ncbi:hypothetical protein ACFPM7_24775 [Actinokineospora guangxiensis]|uniref:Uncharacterized protein n=1 Tax=Actinokineospora guangxiensis TaxID=1490288 RepID=A0ABW0EW13_9PSEU
MFVVVGLGALFLLVVRAAWFFTIDDALITFRYSANLAAGHGPVWNVGEDPVEGFTNFLWMLWHTPFAALGLSLPTVAKLTALAAGTAILVMLVVTPGSGVDYHPTPRARSEPQSPESSTPSPRPGA